MAQVTLPYTLTAGTPENVNNLMSNLTALRDGVNTIDTAQIANGAITSSKLAAEAISDGSITTGKLADRAVTKAKSDNYELLGLHILTTSSSTSDTHTDYQDEGLTASITYRANRVLRVSLNVLVYAPGSSVTDTSAAFRVLRGSTAVCSWSTPLLFANDSTAFSWSYVFNGPSTGGTETFKVQFAARFQNKQVRSYSTTGQSPFARNLVVEDLGPQ